MPKFLCSLLGHPNKHDTGNKISGQPVIRCNNCDRAWFGKDELLPYQYSSNKIDWGK
jgi:hypothetical protein